MKPGPQGDRLYLLHMLECIERMDEYTRAGREAYITSRLIQDPVVRNLQVMSESSQRLSNALKQAEPSVPWRAISGFRNVLVHGYLGADLGIVWRVVERDIPPLRIALRRIVESQDGASTSNGNEG